MVMPEPEATNRPCWCPSSCYHSSHKPPCRTTLSGQTRALFDSSEERSQPWWSDFEGYER